MTYKVAAKAHSLHLLLNNSLDVEVAEEKENQANWEDSPLNCKDSPLNCNLVQSIINL